MLLNRANHTTQVLTVLYEKDIYNYKIIEVSFGYKVAFTTLN